MRVYRAEGLRGWMYGLEGKNGRVHDLVLDLGLRMMTKVEGIEDFVGDYFDEQVWW